jgi:hypothetical protein
MANARSGCADHLRESFLTNLPTDRFSRGCKQGLLDRRSRCDPQRMAIETSFATKVRHACGNHGVTAIPSPGFALGAIGPRLFQIVAQPLSQVV